MDRMKTIAVNAAVIAVISLLLLWGNTRYRQQSQYNLGEKALAAGDYISAIGGFEMAIHMYTPFSSLVEKSAERLWGGPAHQDFGSSQEPKSHESGGR